MSLQKQVVLLGAGHAHMHVIKHWQTSAAPNAQLVVISPLDEHIYSGMLPGLMAGTYSQAQCTLRVARMMKDSPARWIKARAHRIDTKRKLVLLDNGEAVPFDTLSIDIGSAMDKDESEKRMPGASKHAMFIRPIDDFAAQWPGALKRLSSKPQSIVVVGAGAAGVETILAVAKALRDSKTQAGLTLLAGTKGLMHNYPPKAKKLAAQWLKKLNVQVIDQRCAELTANSLTLHGGLRLQCDLAILATGGHAPKMLAHSDLSLNDHGYVRVNEFGQSHSHPNIFAAGDASASTPYPHPRSGVYAVRAGPPLLVNLLASANAAPLVAHKPPTRTLNLLNLSNGRALATWGNWASCSRVYWWWKNAIDKGFVAKQFKRIAQKPAAAKMGTPSKA